MMCFFLGGPRNCKGIGKSVKGGLRVMRDAARADLRLWEEEGNDEYRV